MKIAFRIVVCLAVAPWLLIMGMHQLGDHRINTSHTTGTVINSGTCTNISHAPAEVTYSVDGRKYTTTTGDRCLTVGDHTTVHYDPSDPAHSDFQTTAVTSGLVFVTIGGLVIATAAFIAMGSFRPRGRWAHRGRWAQQDGMK